MATRDVALGIDIGGSGIKGAPVDLNAGELIDDRLRIPTPEPATPEAVIEVIRSIVTHYDLPKKTPVGVTIPSVVQDGVTRSAANIDKSWIGFAAHEALTAALDTSVTIINDADAAGVAELRYGAARGEQGTVVVTTLGTGIGSALLYNGVLIPNTELGHFEIDGVDAEDTAAASVKDREGLSYAQWAVRLQKYYDELEELLCPRLIIIGGGVSKDATEFVPLLKTNAKVVPAKLRNKAGIIGVASLAGDTN